MDSSRIDVLNLPIHLERDEFSRDVVGLDESEGFVSIVGQKKLVKVSTVHTKIYQYPRKVRPQTAKH